MFMLFRYWASLAAILMSLLICAGFVQFPVALLLCAFALGFRSRSIYAVYQTFTGTVVSLWLSCVAAIFECGYGLRYHITCDESTASALRSEQQAALLMCNHRTRLDWAMLWPVLARVGALERLKIITKDALRWTPFFLGPAIQVTRFLFLSRKWALDEHRAEALYTLLRKGPAKEAGWGNAHPASRPPPYALLIFPEGTDLHPAALEKSHAFARGQGRPPLHCVLQPRVKGLAHALLSLAKGLGSASPSERPVESVIDITLAYEGGIPQNEAVLAGRTVSTVSAPGAPGLVGRMPAAVHVHMQAIPIQELLLLCSPAPTSVEALESCIEPWLYRRFAAKEVALRAFYAPVTPGRRPLLDVEGAFACLQECKDDIESAAALLVQRHSGAHHSSSIDGTGTSTRPSSALPTSRYALVNLFMMLAAYLLQYLCRQHPLPVFLYLAALALWLYMLGPWLLGGPLDVLELRATLGARTEGIQR